MTLHVIITFEKSYVLLYHYNVSMTNYHFKEIEYMKRIIALAASAAMACTMFLTGCSMREDSIENQLKSSLDETYQTLVDTFSDSGSKFSMVEEYIKSWAKTNEIEVSKLDDHYMVLTNKATKNAGKSESVALQCSVNTSDIASANQPLAVGLTSLLGPEEHGLIRLIITETTESSFVGAESVASEYLDVDHVIRLTKNSGEDLTVSGAYSSDITLSRNLDYQAPSYTEAYEITMTVSDYNDAFDFSRKYPNPIDVIGSYLASCQSSGKLFQLASLESRVSDSYTPYSAKAVVVIDGNNVESMKKKYEKSLESVKKKCDKLDIDFVYTMTEVSVPSQVISNVDKSDIISLLYTIDPGICYQDEESGEILSADDYVSISTSDSRFRLKVASRAKTQEAMSELLTSLSTTAGLSDIKFKSSSVYMTWSSNEDMADFFKTALSIDDEKDENALKTIKTSDLNILTSKNHDIEAVQYSIPDDGEDVAMLNCIHFISYLNGDFQLPTSEAAEDNTDESSASE